MKRKLIAMLLLVSLCLSLAVGAAAAQGTFIADALGVLSEGDVARLDEMAAALCTDTGVGVYFVYTTAPDLLQYDYTVHTAGMTDYYVMLENTESWYYFAGGRGEELDTESLRHVYDDEATYAGGVEAYLAEAMLQLTLSTAEPESSITAESDLLVWDEAGLLTEAEVKALDSKLESLSRAYDAELRVVTVPSVDGGDVDAFIELLYDGYGFGYGENRDGVLLLVCMDPREYRILSNGYAGDAISTSDIDSMGSLFKSELSDGNYAEAFDTFADQCEYYLKGHLEGFPFNFGFNLVVALVVGLVLSLLVTGIWKRQLKSVHMQHAANVYLKPGSLQIYKADEIFQYSSVSKSRRSDDDDDRSSSSGGGSRSIGGGSF